MALRSKSATKQYAPLAVSAALLIVFLLLLPSSLNLPQANPTEALEYAPVPPDDESPPPTTGNLASLGLGSSSSIAADTEGGSIGGGGVSPGRGRSPSTKRCVGNPPRQTSDPLAPPCVAHFEGNNGGATYQGVTKDEVRILVIVETSSGQCGHFKGCQTRPFGQYQDMDDPEREDDYYQTIVLRNWQRYFNDRYQTYDRHVHFFAYYLGGGQGTSPESRRAIASDNYDVVKPFAVVFDNFRPVNVTAYQEVAHKRGVMVFVNGLGMDASIFQRYPKLAWGFQSSLQEQAKVYADYLCEKVAPNPVSYSGPAYLGRPRKFGLVYNGNPSPNVQYFRDFKDEVKRLTGSCGIDFGGRERTFNTGTGNTADADNARASAEAISFMQGQGVTTIIWPMGNNTGLSKAAEAASYYPEWIVAGDGFNDTSWPNAQQSKVVWDEHAITITPTLRSKPPGYTQPCEDAYTEVHPDIPRDGFDLAQICFLYPGLRQLFTGIQVAGPRLGPTSMDRGYRAIPKVASNDPSTPACFYVPGDSTCVKDTMVQWWDSQSEGQNLEISGCWRMMLGGKRFLPGTWPDGNINKHFTPQDPCNGLIGGN